MTPKQQAIEDMILVGQQMANLCYNLRQNPKLAERPGNINAMLTMQGQWDSCVRVYRKLTKKVAGAPHA